MRKYKKLIRGLLLVLSLATVYFLILLRFRKSKKVLLIAQHIHIGGTSSYFRALCSYFSERGYEVQLLLRRREFTPELQAFLKHYSFSWQLVDHELDHLEYWYDRKHVLRFYFLYSFLQQALFVGQIFLSSRASLIFVSNAYPGDLFPVFILPVRILFIIHSMPWGRLDRGNHYLLEKLIQWFPRHVHFVTVSAFAKNRILQHWHVKGIQRQISFNHNYSPLANSEISYPDRIHEGVTVLTAGSVIGTKNPDLWIRVAKNLISRYSGLQFIWAGDGNELNFYREQTRDCPGIFFIGNVKDIAKLYMQADIYFQPSKWESQGLAVLEAMSYGLPCVATTNGGTAEMIINGLTGMLADPDDEQEFMRQIELLINEPSVRQEMGIRSFQRYMQHFSRERWYARMDELIQN